MRAFSYSVSYCRELSRVTQSRRGIKAANNGKRGDGERAIKMAGKTKGKSRVIIRIDVYNN